MSRIKLRTVDREGYDLGIVTDDFHSLTRLTSHHPKPRKNRPELVAAPQNDLPNLYPPPHFYPENRTEGFLSKAGRTFTILRILLFCAQLALSWPGMFALGGSICATLAVAAGYKMTHAPDTKEGRTVAEIAEAKKGILQKGVDKIRDAASEPLGAVKEKAKVGVEKATAKAAEIKEEVSEAKEAAVEKVDEVKTAIIGAKAEAQPGILEQATSKVAAIPAAISSGLHQPMPAEQFKAMQEKHKAEIDKRKRAVKKAADNRFVTGGVGGGIGSMSIERNRVARENQREAERQHELNKLKDLQYRRSMGLQP